VNQKTKYMIPVFAAIFALIFVFATPYVVAKGEVSRETEFSIAKQYGQVFTDNSKHW